jgi:GRAM domain
MEEPKTPLEPGESALKEGRANLQRGAETVGGRLFLTNRRLIFEAHIFNVQRGGDQIQLGQIEEMRPAWTKFFGVIPLMPSTLSVRTDGGAEYNLVCRGRGAWMKAIREAQGSSESGQTGPVG